MPTTSQLAGLAVSALAAMAALCRRRLGSAWTTVLLGLAAISGIALAVRGRRRTPAPIGRAPAPAPVVPTATPSPEVQPPPPPSSTPVDPTAVMTSSDPPAPRPGRSVTGTFAALIVGGRWVVVLGWVAIAIAATVWLPTIREAQVGALGDLAPAGADAIQTEQRSAELFDFPLLSRTIVVARDPQGLTAGGQARLAQSMVQLDEGILPALGETRGYGITNAIGDRRTMARERSTTAIAPLLFPLDVGPTGRTGAAQRYARDHVAPAVPGAFVGVTGAIAARAEQADVIQEHLPLVEVVTLLFVLAAVGLYFRAVAAPLVNLVAVALAYLVSIRLVAALGKMVGVSVPSEVQPIVVALLFGVVTDYSLFFLSRFRLKLTEGNSPHDAARRTTAELTPIILTCGLAVAAACTALVVADLGFLRAFGPGMAMAVLIGLAVSMTFIPATLALLGPRLYWPATPHADRSPDAGLGPGFAVRVVGAAVRAPRRTIVACLAVLLAMASGIGWLALGNPLIRGLPPGSDARVAYLQASRGFVPGVLSPTVLIVEQPGITMERAKLASLQRSLSAQPGVAEVLGPASNPTDSAQGAVLARNTNAARFVIVLKADPLGAGAVERLRRLQAAVGPLIVASGLGGATGSFAGDTALSLEMIDGTVDDLWRVVPAVLLAVLLVLIVFLRGLVAPLYLVALSALGPLAAVGLTVLFFQGILGHYELTYYVPVAAGVLLVALGSDYNIFLVGRIWDEARGKPLDAAIVSAGAGATRAISAAGIVLAVSFAAMALVPLAAFRELAFVMAAGLLIDAFLVRTILVPAVISLVGYRSGWPGRRLRRPLAPETDR